MAKTETTPANIWLSRHGAKITSREVGSVEYVRTDVIEVELNRLRSWLEEIRDQADPYEGDGSFKSMAIRALQGESVDG